MTTILQSCLERPFIETTTVKLKVATPKSLDISRNSCFNLDLGGWNASSSPKETIEKENVYVHPLTKQNSSSRLSEKSLELCTENLGSETGSDIMDISILSLSSPNSPTSEKSWLKEEEKVPQEVEYSSSSSSKNKVNNSRKFPPPLTTISSSNSLQFRPHREDGRLVIKAVEAPSKHTYFQAERSHGRLRLTFLKDHATKFDDSQLTTTEENEVVDYNEDDYEIDVGDDSDFNDEDHQELEQDYEEEEEEENGTYMIMNRDMDDNIFDIEVEMGREKFQRLINIRCIEGGHGNERLCNWEPLWVATS